MKSGSQRLVWNSVPQLSIIQTWEMTSKKKKKNPAVFPVQHSSLSWLIPPVCWWHQNILLRILSWISNSQTQCPSTFYQEFPWPIIPNPGCLMRPLKDGLWPRSYQSLLQPLSAQIWTWAFGGISLLVCVSKLALQTFPCLLSTVIILYSY